MVDQVEFESTHPERKRVTAVRTSPTVPLIHIKIAPALGFEPRYYALTGRPIAIMVDRNKSRGSGDCTRPNRAYETRQSTRTVSRNKVELGGVEPPS